MFAEQSTHPGKIIQSRNNQKVKPNYKNFLLLKYAQILKHFTVQCFVSSSIKTFCYFCWDIFRIDIFFYVMKFEIWNSNLFFSETQTKPASDSSGDEDSDDENQNGPVEVMLFSLIYFCFWMFKLQFCICQYFLKK